MIDQDILTTNNNFSVACCNFYEHQIVQTLLGSSFHPGGLALTKRLGEELGFTSNDRILDLASGLGTSAIALAEEFGATVVGIELSSENIVKAQKLVEKKKLENLVSFRNGMVDKLPFENNTFDYVLSECSFCLFKDKNKVAQEIHRILKPNGKVIISDIAIEKKLPFDIENLVFQVACIASAVSMSTYANYFKRNGFMIQSLTGDVNILLQFAEGIKKKIFVLELASGLRKIDLGTLNIKEIKMWIEKAKELLHNGYATYMIMIGEKI